MFCITRYITLWKSAGMTPAQLSQWWRRLHDWADVVHARFSNGYISLSTNISTSLFCTAERILRTIIIMQNSRLIQECFPTKIDEVWIDRFFVRYDWLRRLQPQVWPKALKISNALRKESYALPKISNALLTFGNALHKICNALSYRSNALPKKYSF